MTVIFLKDHAEYREGETIDVDNDLATYWLNCGVAALPVGAVDEATIEKNLSDKLKKAKKKK